MILEQTLKQATVEIFKQEFEVDILTDTVTINITKKEHRGDYTIVVFPLIRYSKTTPEQTAAVLGDKLIARTGIVAEYNVIKGFLNLSIRDTYWINSVINPSNNIQHPSSETVLIEFIFFELIKRFNCSDINIRMYLHK